MKTINNVLNWFLNSSKNPTEASLTFKGLLIGFIPLIIGLLQLTSVTVSTTEVNAFINQTAIGLQDILYIVSATVTAWGAIRKVYLTGERLLTKNVTKNVTKKVQSSSSSSTPL